MFEAVDIWLFSKGFLFIKLEYGCYFQILNPSSADGWKPDQFPTPLLFSGPAPACQFHCKSLLRESEFSGHSAHIISLIISYNQAPFWWNLIQKITYVVCVWVCNYLSYYSEIIYGWGISSKWKLLYAWWMKQFDGCRNGVCIDIGTLQYNSMGIWFWSEVVNLWSQHRSMIFVVLHQLCSFSIRLQTTFTTLTELSSDTLYPEHFCIGADLVFNTAFV